MYWRVPPSLGPYLVEGALGVYRMIAAPRNASIAPLSVYSVM